MAIALSKVQLNRQLVTLSSGVNCPNAYELVLQTVRGNNIDAKIVYLRGAFSEEKLIVICFISDRVLQEQTVAMRWL